MKKNTEGRGDHAEPTEKESEDLTPEQQALVEYWLPQYEQRDTSNEERENCEGRVAELEGLLRTFETEYPVAELYAITDLTVEDAPNHPVREPARKALIPIVAMLNYLKEKTNIETEQYDSLFAKYRRLSNAVGMIHRDTGKVRHE